MADDPIARLLPVCTLGGFRYKGSRDAPRLVVLCTTGAEADWPDVLDPATGTFTYYGDNRHPGKDLHDSPRGGNSVLRRTFDVAHDGAGPWAQVCLTSCSPRPAGVATSCSAVSWPQCRGPDCR